MPLLSALRSVLRAISLWIVVALDLLAAIGARRLAETYYALDNEPNGETWTDDEAAHARGVVTAGLRSAAKSFQTGKLTTSAEDHAPRLQLNVRPPSLSEP